MDWSERGARRVAVLARGSILVLLVLPLFAVRPASADQGGLEVVSLSVTPSVVRSAEQVTVEAAIRNSGQSPITGVRVAVAATEDIAGRTRWTVLEATPQDPLPVLLPRAVIAFRARVRLDGDGWLRVGVAALADNDALPPQGVRIRVIDFVTSGADALLLLLVNSALFAGAAGAVALAVRRRGATPGASPARLVLSVAVLLALLGVALMGAVRWAPLPSGQRAWLPLAGTVCLALAWLIGGGGLRPRGSALRGSAVAATLYVLAGLMWVSDFNAALGLPVTRTFADPSFLAIALAWPLQVAQVIGLFGLTVG